MKLTSTQTLIKKLASIFPDDFYLIKNKYIIDGVVGKGKKVGSNFVDLNDECQKIFQEIFGDKDIILIHTKVFKVDVAADDSYEEITVNCDIYNEVMEEMNISLNKITEIGNVWNTIDISDNDILTLYEKYEMINIIVNENDFQVHIDIAKDSLPSITKNNISNLLIRAVPITKFKSVYKVIMLLDDDLYRLYFQFYVVEL